ncbi:MAG: hypothetical protein ACP5MV_01720 [Candidatus Parvarchaeum sp.]
MYKLSKSKRSQSALEYMMTYGWAILIIVIVAVILYSMGIFNPSSSLVPTITGFAGLTVQANCVAGGTLIVSIGNSLGYPVYLENATIYFSNGSSLSEPMDYTLSTSGSHDFYLLRACPNTIGAHFSDKVNFNGIEYNSLNSPIIFTGGIAGSISSLVPYQILETINVQDFPTVNAITPNGYYFWQPNQGNSTISIVNVVSASVVKTLSNLPTRAVVFSNDGELAFIAGNSPISPAGRWMIVMNTSNYQTIKNISGLCDPQILSTTSNGLVIVPDLNTCDFLLEINQSNLAIVKNISTDGLSIWQAEQSPINNSLVYAAGYNGSGIPYIAIIDTATGKIIKNITNSSGNPVIFNPNGLYAYSGYSSNGKTNLTTISTSSLTVIYTKPISNTTSASGMSISNNGQYIYTAMCQNNKIPVYNILTNTVVANITLPYPVNTCVSYSSLSQSNNLLYVAETTTNPGKVFVISV